VPSAVFVDYSTNFVPAGNNAERSLPKEKVLWLQVGGVLLL